MRQTVALILTSWFLLGVLSDSALQAAEEYESVIKGDSRGSDDGEFSRAVDELPPPDPLCNLGFENGETCWTFYGTEWDCGVRHAPPGDPWYSIEAYEGEYIYGAAVNWEEPGEGGCYQRIPATPGVPVSFSVMIQTVTVGGDPSQTAVRIGIDPTGWIDPFSGDIVWSAPTSSPGVWSRLTLQNVMPAGAGDAVTIFLEHVHVGAIEWHVSAIDDAYPWLPPPGITKAESVCDHGGECGLLELEIHLGAENGSDILTESRLQGVHQIDVHFSEALDPATVHPDVVDVVSWRYPIGPCEIGTSLNGCLTIIFDPPLPDQDTYTITIADTVTDLAGNPLGGDRDFNIRALAADVTGDGYVWPNDRTAIAARYGFGPWEETRYDITCDCNIWPNDRSAVPARYGNWAPVEREWGTDQKGD